MRMRDESAERLAEGVRQACLEAAATAFEQGGFSGLCVEGRIELALDAIRALPVERLVREWEAERG